MPFTPALLRSLLRSRKHAAECGLVGRLPCFTTNREVDSYADMLAAANRPLLSENSNNVNPLNHTSTRGGRRIVAIGEGRRGGDGGKEDDDDTNGQHLGQGPGLPLSSHLPPPPPPLLFNIDDLVPKFYDNNNNKGKGMGIVSLRTAPQVLL